MGVKSIGMHRDQEAASHSNAAHSQFVYHLLHWVAGVTVLTVALDWLAGLVTEDGTLKRHADRP